MSKKWFISSTQRDIARRLGTSTVELLVALALLATATIGVGQLASRTKAGLRNRELSSRLNWELTNARETIGAWPLSEITVEKIEQIPISQSLQSRLADLRWEATVESIQQPAKALQVVLSLHCMMEGQSARPVALTFWVDTTEEVEAP